MELSRVEQILKYFLGEEATLPQPLSRVEELLIALGRLIEEGKITNPISIRGRVNTVNDLPSNAEPGWLYFVGLADATEFTEYIYLDSGRWEYLGSSMISIDTTLSTTSTNPVQNSTITNAINALPTENDFPSMTQSEYDALTPSQKTALYYFIHEDDETEEESDS